jgi:hypothetical protein
MVPAIHVRGEPRSYVKRLPPGVLLIIAAGSFTLGLVEAKTDAPTFDEPVYVSPGPATMSRVTPLVSSPRSWHRGNCTR